MLGYLLNITLINGLHKGNINGVLMGLFNRNKKSKNFKYLDKLIHSGSKEIVLDYDIILDDAFLSRESGSKYKDSQLVKDLVFEGDIILETDLFSKLFNKLEPQYLEGIQLDVDNLVIDGNGHTIDAQGKSRIFNCTGKNITIKNITLKNGSGGAIENSGELTLIEIKFLENASSSGGAIHNHGKLTIIKSKFLKNTAQNAGGAAFNYGKLTIIESTFLKNSSGGSSGAISSLGDEITIKKSSFCQNSSEGSGGAIDSSDDTLTIEESVFRQNSSQGSGGAISSSGKEVTIEESVFRQNSSQGSGGAINIIEGNFKVFNCKFYDNKSPDSVITNHDSLNDYNSVFIGNQTEKIIVNEGDNSNYSNIGGKFKDNEVYGSLILNTGKSVTLDRSTFDNNLSDIGSQNIFNEGNLILINPKIKDKGKTILNKGHVLIKKSPEYLRDKINNKGTVETDEPPKEEKYDFGFLDKEIHQNTVKKIILNHDILLETYECDFYEGGIVLDIDNFIIDGNGHAIDGSSKSRIFTIIGNNVTLKNIIFKNGYSHKNYDSPPNNNGGAIKINRNVRLNIENCKFINNVSEEFGGAIYAYGDLSVTESAFNENHAITGGALYATEELSVTESAFNENHAEDSGGAIFNCRDFSLIKSNFLKNRAKNGGAIKNKGALSINNSSLNENHATDGGAIKNNGTLSINNSSLNENHATDGGAIYNYNTLTIGESTINGNQAAINGGGIFNSGSVSIFNSSINNNARKGEDIYTSNSHYKVNANNTVEVYEEFSKTFVRIENRKLF